MLAEGDGFAQGASVLEVVKQLLAVIVGRCGHFCEREEVVFFLAHSEGWVGGILQHREGDGQDEVLCAAFPHRFVLVRDRAEDGADVVEVLVDHVVEELPLDLDGRVKLLLLEVIGPVERPAPPLLVFLHLVVEVQRPLIEQVWPLEGVPADGVVGIP